MKKLLATSFCFVFLSVGASLAGPLCTLAPSGHNPAADTQPTPGAMHQMRQVNDVLCFRFGCPGYRFLQNQTLPNAMASADGTGFTIRHNTGFMAKTVNRFGNLATIGILAHELGHIIDFAQNPGQHISQSQREATADEYAGCAFALAGNNVNDLGGMAAALHAMGPSPGYPTPDQRVQLLLIGYNKCR